MNNLRCTESIIRLFKDVYELNHIGIIKEDHGKYSIVAFVKGSTAKDDYFENLIERITTKRLTEKEKLVKFKKAYKRSCYLYLEVNDIKTLNG